MKCAVGKCKQNNSNKAAAPSFYNFPKDAELIKQWVKFCNRVKPINVMKDKVCGLHFKKEDFERNLKYEMGFSKRRAPKLKPGAVPCLDSNVGETGKKRTKIGVPNELCESEIQIVYDNPSEINVEDENLDEYVTEIKTEIDISDEFESEIKIEQEIPKELYTEIKTEIEISDEYESVSYFESESETNAEIDIPSELETGIRTEINNPNDLDSENKIERGIPIEFDEECLEVHTPMMTDIGDDGLQIKTLEMERDALRQENGTLKRSNSRSDLTIKYLSRRVLKLKAEKANLKKLFRRMYLYSRRSKRNQNRQ